MKDSFFLSANKPIKRNANNRNGTKKPKAVDEDIHSDEEGVNVDKSDNEESSDEEDDKETPAEKRIRIAQEYLATIQDEEAGDESDDGDDSVHGAVSRRLKKEQEERDRKIDRTLASHYANAYDEANVQTLRGHSLSVTCSVISQDERFVFSASKDSVITKWDAKTGEKLCTLKGGKKGCKFKGHTEDILALAVSSDGKYLASGGKEKKIFIWDAENDLKLIHQFKGHKDTISGLVFRYGHHTLYSASFDRTIKIWNCDGMAFVEQLFGHQDCITSIDSLSRERCLSVGGRDRSLRLWKIIEESQLVFDSHGHVGNIECVKMINENMWVSSGEDGKILLWTSYKKRPFFTQTGAHRIKTEKDLEEEAKRKEEEALLDEKEKKKNKNKNNKKKDKLPLIPDPWVTAIASLRYTDLLASGSNNGTIKLWKVEPNKTLSVICEIPMEGYINSLEFSPSGNLLIVSVGQEHRLGRWGTLKHVKNCVKIINLNPTE